jgi:hypothetical protein
MTHDAGFNVLKAVVMKSTIFRDISLCLSSPFKLVSSSFFYLEDRGDMFLRKVECL